MWKVALGVCLGLFLFIAACAAIISNSADEIKEDLDRATDEKQALVRVEADQDVCWSGSIGGVTQEGCGTSNFGVSTIAGDLLAVTVQKRSGGSKPMTVLIEIDGQEKDRKTTTAEFGVVTATSS